MPAQPWVESPFRDRVARVVALSLVIGYSATAAIHLATPRAGGAAGAVAVGAGAAIAAGTAGASATTASLGPTIPSLTSRTTATAPNRAREAASASASAVAAAHSASASAHPTVPAAILSNRAHDVVQLAPASAANVARERVSDGMFDAPSAARGAQGSAVQVASVQSSQARVPASAQPASVEQVEAWAVSPNGHLVVPAKEILLTDRRVRVGEAPFRPVKKALIEFQKSMRMPTVTIAAAADIPETHVKVVKSFMERFYGWKVTTVTAEKAGTFELDVAPASQGAKP